MLTKNQLINLRKNICLNSLFLKDYSNNLYIKEKTVYDFFNGYIDYLYELASDDNFKSDDIIDIINKYDNSDNLYNYYLIYESDPLIKDDYIAYYNDCVFSGCVIYDIDYDIDISVISASYYHNKYNEMIINRITRNKLYYDSKKESYYFIKLNRRYYINDFEKARGL